jgi:uncharacterized membrane protein YfcA
MSVLNFTPEVMRPTAFILNLVVSSVAFLQYYRGGFFNLREFVPYAVGSVPAAFFGSYIPLSDRVYKYLLAFMLFIAAFRFLVGVPHTSSIRVQPSPALSVCIGATIGLVSGMIGIGGGIILSPLLILLGWMSMKQSAALSAAFIFVNSAAGLSALLSKGSSLTSEMLLWVFVVFIGGLIGAYSGSKLFSSTWLRFALVLVLIIAACKLVIV